MLDRSAEVSVVIHTVKINTQSVMDNSNKEYGPEGKRGIFTTLFMADVCTDVYS